MTIRMLKGAVAMLALVSAAAWAQAPADATAQCKDGTYFSGKTRRGACAGHGGIKDWYGEKAASAPAKAAPADAKAAGGAPAGSKNAAATTPAGSTNAAASAPARSAPAATTAPAATPATSAPAATAPAAPAPRARESAPAPTARSAAAGGSGQVWVNKETKIYHCQGDRWYGKTKNGEYMSRSQAEAQGMTAAKGKYCAS